MVPVKIAKFSDPKKNRSKTSHLRTTVLRRQMQSLFGVGDGRDSSEGQKHMSTFSC